MGYTHYFGYNCISQKDWEEQLDSMQMMFDYCKDHSETIIQKDYDDPSPPIFDKFSIAFNGKEDLGHETFFFCPQSDDFHFCKTARKPYDLLVCCTLIILKHHFPHFSFSSDGKFHNQLWLNAFQLVEKLGLACTIDNEGTITKIQKI